MNGWTALVGPRPTCACVLIGLLIGCSADDPGPPSMGPARRAGHVEESSREVRGGEAPFPGRSSAESGSATSIESGVPLRFSMTLEGGAPDDRSKGVALICSRNRLAEDPGPYVERASAALVPVGNGYELSFASLRPFVTEEDFALAILVPGCPPTVKAIDVEAGSPPIIDLGVVRMAATHCGSCRVETEAGQPVAAEVSVTSVPIRHKDGRWLVRAAVDGSGEGTFTHPLAETAYQFEVDAFGLRLPDGAVVLTPEAGSARLVVQPVASWRGRIVDPITQAPLSGIRVQCECRAGAVPISASSTSDPAGGFHITLPSACTEGELSAQVFGATHAFGRLPATDGLVLGLPMRTVRVQMRWEDESLAKSDLGYRFHDERASGSRLAWRVYPAGLVGLEGLTLRCLEGEHWFQAIPLRRAWFPSRPVRIGPRGDWDCVVSIEPARELVVRVVRPDGEPLPGADVWTIRGRAVLEPPSGIRYHDLAEKPREAPDTQQPAPLWDHARTDPKGLGSVRYGEGPVGLWVRAAGFPPAVVPDLSLGGARQAFLEVKLGRGGILEGAILDWLSPSRPHGLVLRGSHDGRRTRWPPDGTLTIERDGTFVHGGLPVGRFELQLEIPGMSQSFLVAEVDVEEGKVSRVRVDARAAGVRFHEATLRFSLPRPEVDADAAGPGPTPPGGTTLLFRFGDDDRAREGGYGPFDVEGSTGLARVVVPPGRYLASVALGHANRRLLYAESWIEIPLQGNEAELALSERMLRVQLLRNGLPFAADQGQAYFVFESGPRTVRGWVREGGLIDGPAMSVSGMLSLLPPYSGTWQVRTVDANAPRIVVSLD